MDYSRGEKLADMKMSRWEWVGVDGSGREWMGVDGSEWEWMGVGGSGWEWVGVSGSGWERKSGKPDKIWYS